MRPTSLVFLNSLVTIRASHHESEDGFSILDHQVNYGDSPPLHIHETEDEVFHILEGRFRLHCDGKLRAIGPGEIVVAPKGLPHTYRVVSPEGGRFLTITTRGDFERFVRELGTETLDLTLPTSKCPMPEQVQKLVDVAASHHIQIVGPPMGPDEDIVI